MESEVDPRQCRSWLARLAASPWLGIFAGVGLAALAAVSLLPAEHSPPRTGLPGPVEHFIAYLAVSAVAAIAFHRLVRPRQLALAMIGYAAVLELAQWWSPGRSPGMIEFAAGSVGAVAGIILGALLLRGLAR